MSSSCSLSPFISDCPAQAGYAEYEYEGSVVCLRFVNERMSHAAAVSLCAEHRASLVMVKDDHYRLFLRQLLIGQSRLIFKFY